MLMNILFTVQILVKFYFNVYDAFNVVESLSTMNYVGNTYFHKITSCLQHVDKT